MPPAPVSTPPPVRPGSGPRTAPGRGRGTVARSLVFSRRSGRPRIPWLIALPILGAYLTLTVVEVLVPVSVAQPVRALLVIGSGGLAAVLLVHLGHRYLGAPRSVLDHGLRVDRRWLADLAAGLVVGLVAYALPMAVAIAAGGFSVAATFDPGDLPLWPGVALMVVANLCTGFWEELLLRGVFIANAVDGLRRRLSDRAAVAVAIVLSATVFGLPHLAQPTYPVLILTWVFSGIVFGVVFVLTGNLAFVIGAHTTFNVAANVLFVRTGTPGAAGQSALVRVSDEAGIAALTPGGVVEVAAFTLLGVLGLLWVRASRGSLRLATPLVLPLRDGDGDGTTVSAQARPAGAAAAPESAP